MDIGVAEGEAGERACPRDLLRRFAGTNYGEKPPLLPQGDASFTASSSAEMDLCLGLSLGGCFARDSRLVRSSSIAELSILSADKDYPPPAVPLARTCSLPAEAEEEHRKRKELQSLKRLEAKRKREEKRNFLRPGSEGELFGGVPPKWGMGGGGAPAAVSPARPAGMRRSSSSFDFGASRVPELPVMNSEPVKTSSLPSSPETYHKSAAAVAAPAIPPGPAFLRSLKSLGEDEEAVTRMTARSLKVSKDVESSIMEEMPCVSTKGAGPNGTRIEGFLYRYKKGEEVRIVCVCHGRFLTPAEFIKHAGGGDVDYPLRHIVVNPSSSSASYS